MKYGVKVLMILTLVFAMMFTVYADTASDAELLSELNLLSGTGAGFELDKELTRAQASTFIVKIMGEQSNVLSNPETITAFSDVKGNEWFVPYVSYCYTNGIVSGYPDGTFQPNKLVSEQEFLSMMLKVIGETDTAWNMIHSKAYSEGLITASTVDANFLRGDVVSIMTNSLELEVEGTSDTVISRLVSKGVITEDLAVEKGLMIKDELKSKISSVKVTSANDITITMNEEITAADVTIIDKSNKSVDVSKVSFSKKVISVETADLENEEYTVILNGVVDKQEIATNNLTSTFMGLPEIVESDYFQISTVRAISKNLVHVTFTHPITTNVTLPGNYDITLDGKTVVPGGFSTLRVELVTGDEYTVALWLREYTLLDGAPYKVIVDGDIQSKYTAVLNNGDDESFRFAGSGQKDNSFEDCLEKAIQQFQSINANNRLIIAYTNLTHYFASKARYKESSEYLSKAFSLAASLNKYSDA